MNTFVKWSLRTMFVLAVLVGFTACEEEEPYPPHPLVGQWNMVAPLTDFYSEFTFYEDGTGNYYVDDAWGQDNYYIEWYAEGNQLWVDFPGEMDSMYFLWSVSDTSIYSGTTLYLYPEDEVNPWVYRAVW